MRTSLAPGLQRTESVIVDSARTIRFLGESMRVYSTPAMVSDIEYACLRLIEEHLDEGESSVGIRVSVDHLAAALLGERVDVAVKVASVEGRKVTMKAEVRDATELIGCGEHVRIVIDLSRQAARLKEKANRLAKTRRPAE
jgi:fluoroacetyl-CoA thioesterase